MDLPSLYPAFLALALVAGGTTMVLGARRNRRSIIAERVAQVASIGPLAISGRVARPETALLRFSVSGLRDADLAVIARLCHRFAIPAGAAPTVFAVARLAAGAALALATLVLVRMSGHASGLTGLALQAMVPIAVAVGWMIPLELVRRIARRRAQAVSAGLPEALELLVVCVEAGLALQDAIDRVTGELRKSQPQLAEELEVLSADLKILPDRDQAFTNLAERADSPSIRSIVTTLSQTLRYGTPLAGALRMAAAELRSESLLMLEERANRLPSLLTVPMMMFIMPTVFLMVGGPAALRLIDVLANR